MVVDRQALRNKVNSFTVEQKISAIQMVKNETDWGLREAKDFVEGCNPFCTLGRVDTAQSLPTPTSVANGIRMEFEAETMRYFVFSSAPGPGVSFGRFYISKSDSASRGKYIMVYAVGAEEYESVQEVK